MYIDICQSQLPIVVEYYQQHLIPSILIPLHWDWVRIRACTSKRRDVRSTSTVHTEPLFPSYVPNRSPLWENQTLITESFEQENKRSPSALNLIWVNARSWPSYKQKKMSHSKESRLGLKRKEPCRRIGLYMFRSLKWSGSLIDLV